MGEPSSPDAGDGKVSPGTTTEPTGRGASGKPDGLETWALATFDVVTLGLVLVLAGHASGALADVLPGVGALPGIAVFAYLWTLVLVGARRGLPADGLETVRTDGLSPVLRGGVVAGTIAGAGFVLGVALVVGLPAIVFNGASPAVVLLFGGLGTGVGGLVGALLGATFATLDVVLYVTARGLVPDR